MSKSIYALRMARLSARIFGDLSAPSSSNAQRIFKSFKEKPWDLREEYMNYYPPHDQWSHLMYRLRHYGLFRDEHEDFREEMKRLRVLRGKVRPTERPKNKKDDA